MMKYVCTVDKMTPLNIHLMNALSPGLLQVMLSNGLTQQKRVRCPQQQKKYCLGFLATVTIRN